MDATSNTEQLLFTTTRIETLSESGKHGVATGFFLGYEFEGNTIPFLITNKHVIKGSKEVKLHFVKSKDNKPLLGHGLVHTLKDFEQIWFCHLNPKIDIAILPFKPLYDIINREGKPFFRSIGSDITASNDDLKELDALEDVVFIGYPYGLWDSKNLLPIIRKGITATSIGIDFKGEKQFLIDASVFPGSSGSPVFIYNKGFYTLKDGYTIPKNRLLFIGILSSILYRKHKNEIQIITEPTKDTQTSVYKERIDLGKVFNSSAIIEVIESFLQKKGEYFNKLKKITNSG